MVEAGYAKINCKFILMSELINSVKSLMQVSFELRTQSVQACLLQLLHLHLQDSREVSSRTDMLKNSI